ncbi:carotenoid 1,2-hydratase [Alginatibacterium sediminis]|uniref:Carotenoid 1,2-hydratase n=1 Tax=Alginatibacterium sediminis TaxID=2164068 RepID=A0A420E879_9ALTE|nr:lipocalin-like domain-containing protein [Alginatibacterium sediminis]RKF15686.1 carotenoid 1,2-hydratase [Alginatibacterium sediminis]
MVKLSHIVFGAKACKKLLAVLLVNALLLSYLLSHYQVSQAAGFSALISGNTLDANYVQVEKNTSLEFMRDHGEHPLFRNEWWYVTANLVDENGQWYALQWTQFRFRDAKGNKDGVWSNQQSYMAHAVLNTKDSQLFNERFARGGVGNAGVELAPLAVYIDDWQWQSKPDSMFPATLSLSWTSGESINVHLDSLNTPVLQGHDGYSIKYPNSGLSSYYYSFPNIDVNASFEDKDGKKISLSGHAWFDHEWSSQFLADQYHGWDWFSLKLDSGQELMLFQMRREDGKHYWSGTLSQQGLKTHHINTQQVRSKVSKAMPVQIATANGVTNADMPLVWQIEIPEHQIDIQVSARKQQAWVPARFGYFEGPVDVNGSHQGQGFLELTGYQ